MWYVGQWNLVLVGWRMLQESAWSMPALVVGFAACRFYIAVRAWRQEGAAVSRDFDNLSRRLQIYAEFARSSQEIEDIRALIALWITRLWNNMSRPQLILLYREAQRAKASYLRQEVCDLLREKYRADSSHWLYF